MTTKERMNTYRTTATVVGIVWLAGFVLAVVGNNLILSILGAPNHLSTVSANSMQVAIGGVLMLICAAAEVALGVLMFPVLKQHNERIALGYLGSKIIDAVFFTVWVIFLLIQIPLGSEYLKAGALDTSFLQALSSVSIQGEPVCLSDQPDRSCSSWFPALLHVLQDKVGSALGGRLGPRWVRGPAGRVCVGNPGYRSASNTNDSRRPVGAVHMCLADR